MLSFGYRYSLQDELLTMEQKGIWESCQLSDNYCRLSVVALVLYFYKNWEKYLLHWEILLWKLYLLALHTREELHPQWKLESSWRHIIKALRKYLWQALDYRVQCSDYKPRYPETINPIRYVLSSKNSLKSSSELNLHSVFRNKHHFSTYGLNFKVIRICTCNPYLVVQ